LLAPNRGNNQQEAGENQRQGSNSHFARPQVNLCDSCTLAHALWARELKGRRIVLRGTAALFCGRV
jgi:hypothetical protein